MAKRSKLNNCTMEFDNRPSLVFSPGELVTGKVIFTPHNHGEYRGITLTISGSGVTNWSEQLYKRTEYYEGKESYFENKIDLLENNAIIVENNATLYPFTFILPSDLPSSHSGKYGKIQYEARVIAERAFHGDYINYIVPITVISNLELITLSNIKAPYTVVKSEEMHSLMLKRGTIEIRVKVQHRGYVPGQDILIECNIKNGSKVNVSRTIYDLIKEVIYAETSPNRKTKVVQKSLVCLNSDGAKKNEENQISINVAIPISVEPSTLNRSSIIKITYVMKVEAVVDGLHSNMIFRIPIIIGRDPSNNILECSDVVSKNNHKETTATLDQASLEQRRRDRRKPFGLFS